MSLKTVASQFLSTIETSVTNNRNSLSSLSPSEISHRASFIDALESCSKVFKTISDPFLNESYDSPDQPSNSSEIIDSE